MSKFFAKVKNNRVLDTIVADQNFINSLPKEDGVIWVESTHNVFSGKEHDDEDNVIADNRQMNTAVKGGFIIRMMIFFMMSSHIQAGF